MEDQINLNNSGAFFFDIIEDALLLFDKNFILIDCNQIVLKGGQLKKENIIGLHVTQIYPNAENEGWLDLYKRVLTNNETIIKEDYKPHPKLGNNITKVKCFKAGEGLGVIVKVITESKQSYNDLQTFIYKISHDLRSPLTNLLGLIEFTENECVFNENQNSMFQIIKNQATILDTIIHKLSKTMQISTVDENEDKIDFDELLYEVLDSLNYMKEIENIKIKKNIIVSNFYSDKILLIFLFQNILNNAIKFKRNIPDSKIDIEITELNCGVNIIIFDNGIGIKEQQQSKIYDLFHKGTHIAEGNGLGLFTAFQILQKLGGFIKCDSKEGEHTKFSIYIPNKKLT